jgi:hypothetical protein
MYKLNQELLDYLVKFPPEKPVSKYSDAEVPDLLLSFRSGSPMTSPYQVRHRFGKSTVFQEIGTIADLSLEKARSIARVVKAVMHIASSHDDFPVETVASLEKAYEERCVT